ncbi:hypothetical protein LBMAG56_02090 [Verrucomicrobiota bacterium]|nr:hypothetical protein LBMAG56_02090 [Verrucomicrobiota bacterium]
MMNPLQKKCLLASGGLHGLLLCSVLFGAAFRSRDKVEVVRPAEFISAANIESLLRTKTGTPPLPRPPVPQVEVKPVVDPLPAPPTPKPPLAEVKPPKPAPTPDSPPVTKKISPVPVKLTEVVRPVPGAETIPIASAGTKPSVKVSLENLKVRGGEKSATKPATKLDTGHLAQAHQVQHPAVGRVSDVLANLQRNLAHSTAVGTSDGASNEATADYGLLVVALYQAAWIVPQDVADSGIVAQATVTIGRDGRVTDARLTKSSGKAALDKSIQSALRGVKVVAPFPPADKEKERTFIIDFNLKAKRLLG